LSGEEVLELAALDDDRFILIEAGVNGYFQDGWEQSSFAALSRQRLRRFGRYA
jgi:hypothetical protein